MNIPNYVSAKDIMLAFRVSKGTAYRWINKMKTRIRVGDVLRVSEAEVRSFVESNTICNTAEAIPMKSHPDWPQPTQPRKKRENKRKIKEEKDDGQEDK